MTTQAFNLNDYSPEDIYSNEKRTNRDRNKICE